MSQASTANSAIARQCQLLQNPHYTAQGLPSLLGWQLVGMVRVFIIVSSLLSPCSSGYWRERRV